MLTHHLNLLSNPFNPKLQFLPPEKKCAKIRKKTITTTKRTSFFCLSAVVCVDYVEFDLVGATEETCTGHGEVVAELDKV